MGTDTERPTIKVTHGDWRNFHRTVLNHNIGVAKYDETGRWMREPAATWTLADLGRAIGQQQQLLARTTSELLIAGSAWSHARLLTTDQALFKMAGCAGIVPLVPGDLVDPDAAPLCLVAGGTRIKPLARWLEQHGTTLRTSGSHGAQTMAGALATGTHGARLGCRGVEAHVRGALVIAGSNRLIWVAPDQGPAPSPATLNAIQPSIDLHRNQSEFEAVLSHLGGLGLIAAVLFDPEPLYHLELVRRVVPLWPNWQRDWASGDFAAIAAHIEADVRHDRPTWRRPGELIYCEVNIDPWQLTDGNGCFQLRYRLPNLAPGLLSPEPEPAAVDLLAEGVDQELDAFELALADKQIAGLDLPGIFERIARDENMPTATKQKVGSPESMLPATHEFLKRLAQIWSCAVALPLVQLEDGLAALSDVAQDQGSRNFVACLRPVWKSAATLGFCGYERSIVIDIDGLGKRWAGDAVELTGRAFSQRLAARGVPHRMHWGKLGEPDRLAVEREYSVAALNAWENARANLLEAEGRRIFTSPKLRALELA